MILVDANLLLYAANRDATEHASARSWLDERLNGTARVGLPWPQVQDWLACDAAWIPLPGARHAEVLSQLLEHRVVTSRLVPDAHLAALAIEHGLTLCSTDGDFAKFPDLKWVNPLL